MFWTGLVPSGKGLRRALCKLGLAAVVASGLAGLSAPGPADAKPPVASTQTVALASLPAEAQTTHRLILDGGPFPFAKDGSVFGNFERRLPPRPRGQYREYTVITPGAKNRGARRIVCGGLPPSRPETCFYTDDHYASFRRIEP